MNIGIIFLMILGVFMMIFLAALLGANADLSSEEEEEWIKDYLDRMDKDNDKNNDLQ